jgi:hypothetical protein
MPTPLTRSGARSLTTVMDRCASAIQAECDRLDIPTHIAKDYALRSDMLTDHIERKAIAYEKAAGADVDDLSVEEMKVKPTEQQVDDDPKSDDQNTLPNATSGDKMAADDALLRKLLAEEKMAAPEFAQPARNETGDSVEPGGASGAGWDPNAIADDRGGPYKAEPDEPFMGGEFTQEEFHALRDKQQSGQMPKVDGKLAFAKLAFEKQMGKGSFAKLLAAGAKLAGDEGDEEALKVSEDEEADADASKKASGKFDHGFNLSE